MLSHVSGPSGILSTNALPRFVANTIMIATSVGNVSKIGALAPNPGLSPNLRAYYAPVPDLI